VEEFSWFLQDLHDYAALFSEPFTDKEVFMLRGWANE
jgi:hypothetical protein